MERRAKTPLFQTRHPTPDNPAQPAGLPSRKAIRQPGKLPGTNPAPGTNTTQTRHKPGTNTTPNTMKHSAFKLFTKAAFYAPETGQWSDLNQFLKDARESAIAAGFTLQWSGPDWEVWGTCPVDGNCRTMDTGENIETTEIWQLLAALLALPQGDGQSLAQKLMEAAARRIQPTPNY
jgi:hypothetical protein